MAPSIPKFDEILLASNATKIHNGHHVCKEHNIIKLSAPAEDQSPNKAQQEATLDIHFSLFSEIQI
jgi:hypothetical protein